MRLFISKQHGFQTMKSKFHWNGMAIDTSGRSENPRGNYLKSLRFPNSINDEWTFHQQWKILRLNVYRNRTGVVMSQTEYLSVTGTFLRADFRFPGARFSKVPKTFRAWRALGKTPTRLFWKAGLFKCCKGNKIKVTTKILASRRLRWEDTKRIMMFPEIRPNSLGTFEKRAPDSRPFPVPVHTYV